MLNATNIRRLSLLGSVILAVARLLFHFSSFSSAPFGNTLFSLIFGSSVSSLSYFEFGGFGYIIAFLAIAEIICALVAAGCYFIKFLSGREIIDLFTSIAFVFSFGGIFTALMFFFRARKVNPRIAFIGLVAFGVSVFSIFTSFVYGFMDEVFGYYYVSSIMCCVFSLITIVVPKAYFLLEDISEG